MRSEKLLPILNLQSFYTFAKLNKQQQLKLLKQKGIYLDHDCEKDTIIKLYFLQGFFVEEIISLTTNKVIYIIPYKQGYKIESFMDRKKESFSEKNEIFQCCFN